MENEARNEVQATQESTDEVILNTVLTMNGKDTSDEGEYDEDERYPVSNSEATSAIETLQRYLRQREDCKSDLSSMKIGEVSKQIEII